MNLDNVGPGKNVPVEVNVIIEIPSHSDPVKYEVDRAPCLKTATRLMYWLLLLCH